VGNVCDIRELRQAITYIECNNIGLLASYNAHRIVSSYVPFILSNDHGEILPLSLYGILRRKNTQWISLQYSDLILAIFGLETSRLNGKTCDSQFHSLQMYGKVRLLGQYELLEIGSILSKQHDLGDDPTYLVTEYTGFEFTAQEIYGVTGPTSDSRSGEFLKQNLFDLTVKRMI